jgi:hypothetical protein
MNYCVVKLMCTMCNYTVRLIAATGKKSVDEMTAAGTLMEICAADKIKPGYTPVHHKEGNVEGP